MNEGLKFDIEANPWGTEFSKKGIITTEGEGATHATVRAENGLEIISSADKIRQYGTLPDSLIRRRENASRVIKA